MLEGGGPAACPPRRSHGNGSAASHFVPYATSCPLCFCCGGHWGKERASGFSQAWPRATRRTLKAEGGWSCPPQREVGWWEALCKALPAGMGCSRRGEAKREAGSVPAWQRPLGSRLRGVPAPSPLLRALAGAGGGGCCLSPESLETCPGWGMAPGSFPGRCKRGRGMQRGAGRARPQFPVAASLADSHRCKLMMSVCVGGGRARGRAAPRTPK